MPARRRGRNAPIHVVRRCAGAICPTTPAMSGTPHPLRPNPPRRPALRKSISGVSACAIKRSPVPYSTPPRAMVFAAPKRVANAPANAAPAPIRRFCVAIANDNTSRPQFISRLIGRIKRPILCRVPYEIITMTMQETRMKIGLRQMGLVAMSGPD